MTDKTLYCYLFILEVEAKDVVIVDGKQMCIEDIQISRLVCYNYPCLWFIQVVFDTENFYIMQSIKEL